MSVTKGDVLICGFIAACIASIGSGIVLWYDTGDPRWLWLVVPLALILS